MNEHHVDSEDRYLEMNSYATVFFFRTTSLFFPYQMKISRLPLPVFKARLGNRIKSLTVK